ncbi:MAG: YqeG family HAD IIIA-type phosphatase [Fimbriimonadaceae bacterium]|nr:YqeG family HAD IIIA-type phosphatase [Fimbriimonadaceae bacterium]
MRHFRPGVVDRTAVPLHIRRFSPVAALHTLEEVNLQELWNDGKRLILLDVDNTLLPWRAEEISKVTFDWITAARTIGFELCILSNTRNPERLERLSAKLDVPFIRDKFKPHPRMYELAVEKYKVHVDEAVMIGDQLLTDIWGANRAGIDAIWVKPIGKREFVGTRYFSRNVEKIIGRFLYRYFQADGADAIDKPGFFSHNIIRQFVKFAMVGGVATAVDWGLHYVLMFKAQAGSQSLRDVVGEWTIRTFNLGWPLDAEHLQDAAYAPLKIGPVLIAIFVSYYLNRLYTFRTTHEKITVKQVAQFYTVALIGMVISVSVGAVGQRLADASPMMKWAAASVLGMVTAFFWNFAGQRLWTFKKK